MTDNTGGVLWRARVDGRQVDRSDVTMPPTPEDAYAIQSEQIGASGLAVAGWKVGATNEAAQSIMGLDAPFVGPVLQRDIHASGGDVPVFAAQGPGLECEFALELARDIACRAEPYTGAEVSAAIAAVRPSFEIVALRFTGGPKGAGRLLIADGGANAAIVIGDPFADLASIDFSNHRVSLTLTGRPIIKGSSEVSMWEQLVDAVIWLAAQAAVAPRGLRAGDIIMTGTCTGLTPIKPGEEAVADFGTVGKVTAHFVEIAPSA